MVVKTRVINFIETTPVRPSSGSMELNGIQIAQDIDDWYQISVYNGHPASPPAPSIRPISIPQTHALPASPQRHP